MAIGSAPRRAKALAHISGGDHLREIARDLLVIAAGVAAGATGRSRR